MTEEIKCSFCGKASSKVEKMITGNKASICNYCIDICNDIIFEEKVKKIIREMVK